MLERGRSCVFLPIVCTLARVWQTTGPPPPVIVDFCFVGGGEGGHVLDPGLSSGSLRLGSQLWDTAMPRSETENDAEKVEVISIMEVSLFQG